MEGEFSMFNMMLKCAESEADTQQHLHKRSAEAVVVGQTSMGAHFLHFLHVDNPIIFLIM